MHSSRHRFVRLCNYIFNGLNILKRCSKEVLIVIVECLDTVHERRTMLMEKHDTQAFSVFIHKFLVRDFHRASLPPCSHNMAPII